MSHPISNIIQKRKEGKNTGIYSACSANAYVIEAVLEQAMDTRTYALIESTANQVNQYGGYTGMKPSDFADFVHRIASELRFPMEKLILGGDHLGPLTWQKDSEAEAMAKAETLVRDYVLAGFTKIHIDTSMRVADDDVTERLKDETIARRAARLCRAAEEAYQTILADNPQSIQPVYVIGSEVPIPGGATENNEEVCVTGSAQFEESYGIFRKVFEENGCGEAFERVVGVVVQPGVEFSDLTVTEYDRDAAKELCAALRKHPGIVFEGHSTDYQTPQALRQMVEDGIAILKVGPALTFALRQALFALDDMENEVLAGQGIPLSDFKKTLENVMLSRPDNWAKYYHGSEREIVLKRKYSFSDRCRYYLPDPEVESSLSRLVQNINEADIPISVIEQYMPIQYRHLREGKISKNANELIRDRIKDYIDDYIFAIRD